MIKKDIENNLNFLVLIPKVRGYPKLLIFKILKENIFENL